MAWIGAILCSGLLCLIVFEHAARLPKAQAAAIRRWLSVWILQGLALPTQFSGLSSTPAPSTASPPS